MGAMMIFLRIVHIVCGVYWAGTLLFVATFLEPAVRESGPEGAKVMAALLRRRYLDVMPAIAAITILAGLALMWRDSAGRIAPWFGSVAGRAYSTGALAALIAFTVGVFVLRPTVLRIGPLMQAAMQNPDVASKEAQMALVQSMRRRVTRGGRAVAAFLAITVVAMAVARYLG